MARPRVYRYDVRCPECGSNWMPKDGTSKGRQVYHCSDCGRRTIPDAAHQRPGADDEERARPGYVSYLLVCRQSASGLQGGDRRHGGRPAGGGGDCLRRDMDLPASSAARQGSGRRRRRPRAVGGPILRLATAARRPFCGSTKGCRQRSRTARMAIGCLAMLACSLGLPLADWPSNPMPVYVNNARRRGYLRRQRVGGMIVPVPSAMPYAVSRLG